MYEAIDKYLIEISEKGKIVTHKDSPMELIKVIPKMEAYELVKIEDNLIELTKIGYEVIRLGGFQRWLKMGSTASNEEIIRDEAKQFAKFNIHFDELQNPIETFEQINIRLRDFYSNESKSFFLDELKSLIVDDLQSHIDKRHGGVPSPDCGWEKKAKKLLYYVNQHSGTLPLVAHQKAKEIPGKKRLKVFVSYCRKDEEFLNEIKVHFKPFDEIIDFWEDSKIEPGKKWRLEIEKALEETKVGILLVSSDFLASEFIANNELPAILNAAENEGAVILTIILRPCVFEHFNDLNQYQALNQPSKPLSSLNKHEKEEIYANLVRQTLKVLKRD